METAALQPPKTGKSRFSKALPAPPSFLKSLKGLPSSPQPSKTHLPPARKPLPTGPPPPPPPPVKESQDLPSPVSPSDTIMTATPLDSPLPPVPYGSKSSAPLPSIPRRPVAAVSPGLTSPDDSPLSSLLSAYTDHSNRSSDSTHLSSNDGVASAGSVQPSPKLEEPVFTANASSPRLDELFFTPLTIQGDNNAAQNQERSGGPQKSAEGSAKQLPQPPFKDLEQPVSQRYSAAESSSPLAGLASFTTSAPQNPPQESTLGQSQQSQPQIWRRRSLKAEKNLAVTDLKLVSSNGSTTLTSTLHPSEPPIKEQTIGLLQPQISTSVPTGAPSAPPRSPLPATPNAALPGKNIRPATSRQHLAEDSAADSMGQEVSRVKNTLRKKADRGDAAAGGVTRQASPPGATTSHAKNASISSPVRLPTPEYDAGDFKGPIVETIVSPVSPASSPELPSEPRQQRPVQEAKDVVRHAKSNSSFNAGTSGSDSTVKLNRSHALAQKPSLQGLGVRPAVGLPSSPAASRSGGAQPQSQFPARSSSKATPSASATENPAVAATPVPPSKGRTLSEVGSIETIKASVRQEQQFFSAPETQQPPAAVKEEDGDDTTDNPGAARFPLAWAERPLPLPAGGGKDAVHVFQPPPVAERHHACLSRHRVMPETRNTFYPLACQACRVRDTAPRYVCSTCSIRVCGSCRKTLGRFRGDLAALMRHVDAVIVEQSTEMEYDAEEARIRSGKAGGAAAGAATTSAAQRQ